MIGKPEWFKRRKYMGWGFFPAKWQGWAYVAAIVAIILVIQWLPISGEAKLITLMVFGVVFSVDAVHIMITMKKDERERLHEAISERNAMWAMIVMLCVGVAYQAAQSAAYGTVKIDPVVVGALFAALAAKAMTNFYLDRKR